MVENLLLCCLPVLEAAVGFWGLYLVFVGEGERGEERGRQIYEKKVANGKDGEGMCEKSVNRRREIWRNKKTKTPLFMVKQKTSLFSFCFFFILAACCKRLSGCLNGDMRKVGLKWLVTPNQKE